MTHSEYLDKCKYRPMYDNTSPCYKYIYNYTNKRIQQQKYIIWVVTILFKN